MKARRQFSKAFKVEAVKLGKERGVSVLQACGDLDAQENVLRKWIMQRAQDLQQAFRGTESACIVAASVAR
jgi:transposase